MFVFWQAYHVEVFALISSTTIFDLKEDVYFEEMGTICGPIYNLMVHMMDIFPGNRFIYNKLWQPIDN